MEACLDMVLHDPVSPMMVGVSPLSKLVVPEPSNLPLMVYGGFEDDVDCSPIACELLGHFLPPGSPPVAVVVRKGEGEVVKSQKSKRVDRHMSGFIKFVSFPMDDFEEEFLALFQRIEESRNLQKRATMQQKSSKSGLKGTRELRNLVSSVNYKRKQLCAR